MTSIARGAARKWTEVKTMRLIDADAELAKDQRDYEKIKTLCNDVGRDVDIAHEAIANMLLTAPTVDAEPVRHLRRSDVYEPFYQFLGMTSASDYWIALRSLIDDLVEDCGAKMDEEGEHED